MKNCFVMVLCTLCVVALAGVPHAQERPADSTAAEEARRKAAAQAAREDLTKMAAEQAEAVERARRKVADDAARQDLARATESWKSAEVTPVDVELVISRFQGDKKVSSLPYALTVNAVVAPGIGQAPLTQLRMGGQIPMPTMAPPIGPDGKPFGPMVGGGPVQYREVGTNIDARARMLDGGRYEVWVSVEDSAAATPQGADAAALPVIRTFRSANNLVLRDGQTRQFTAASDRITGEVVRVEVTLRVVK